MDRCDGAVPAAHMEEELRAENERLRQEVAVLEEIAEGVAEANANAVEMMLDVERAQAEVNATNAKLRAIIDNVEFGFLICDRTLRVSEEVTHSCLSLFGQSKVASRQLDEVLGLDQDQAASLQMAIEEVFEDFLPEELTCEQIPSRFEIDGRVISMHARALRDESGEVQSLLFSIMDETDLEDERRQNAQNKALLKILNDRSAFLNFIGEMRSNVERARAALAAGEQTLLRRIVHTIKGNSAIFGLLDVVATAHRVEDGRTITSGGIAAIEDEDEKQKAVLATMMGFSAYIGGQHAIAAYDYSAFCRHAVELLEEGAQVLLLGVGELIAQAGELCLVSLGMRLLFSIGVNNRLVVVRGI